MTWYVHIVLPNQQRFVRTIDRLLLPCKRAESKLKKGIGESEFNAALFAQHFGRTALVRVSC